MFWLGFIVGLPVGGILLVLGTTCLAWAVHSRRELRQAKKMAAQRAASREAMIQNGGYPWYAVNPKPMSEVEQKLVRDHLS